MVVQGNVWSLEPLISKLQTFLSAILAVDRYFSFVLLFLSWTDVWKSSRALSLDSYGYDSSAPLTFFMEFWLIRAGCFYGIFVANNSNKILF